MSIINDCQFKNKTIDDQVNAPTDYKLLLNRLEQKLLHLQTVYYYFNCKLHTYLYYILK